MARSCSFLLPAVVAVCAVAAFGFDAVIPQVLEGETWVGESSEALLHPAYVSSLNQKAKSWNAGISSPFDSMSTAEAEALVGCSNVVRPKPQPSTVDLLEDSSKYHIPKQFDARLQWPDCVHPIRNQFHCGSCWAFGATEAFSDRICISSNDNVNVILSPEELVSCDKGDMGCHGGYLQSAWDFMARAGAITDACMPYAAQNGTAPKCARTCVDGSVPHRYFVARGSIVTVSDEKSIQLAILKNGPVEASFLVYRDFFAYKSGVYRHTDEMIMGGHAIKLIGWGVDEATKMEYWIAANSWGPFWGEQGFFKILRGSDECYIESNVVAGLADLTRSQ